MAVLCFLRRWCEPPSITIADDGSMHSDSINQDSQKSRRRQRITDVILVTVGYILSPLSWWNDLFVNIPLSYAFAFPFAFIDQRLFLPSFILGYWLSNLLGFLLLHRGMTGLISKQRKMMGLRTSLLVALLYTLVIVALVWLQWIPMPKTLLR